MHTRVYQEFEKLCSKRNIGGSILEVGAMPSSRGLLSMKACENAVEKIGINLDGPHEFNDIKILRGNANSMDVFENDRFDVVLCNAMLEHDKFFWKTIAEIKRVTKPGGLIMIGAPGYKYYKIEKVKRWLRKTPILRRLMSSQYLNMLFTATITFQIHNAPGDYYRFSPQTFREVFFEDFDNVEICAVMSPPRIIGVGMKKPKPTDIRAKLG